MAKTVHGTIPKTKGVVVKAAERTEERTGAIAEDESLAKAKARAKALEDLQGTRVVPLVVLEARAALVELVAMLERTHLEVLLVAPAAPTGTDLHAETTCRENAKPARSASIGIRHLAYTSRKALAIEERIVIFSIQNPQTIKPRMDREDRLVAVERGMTRKSRRNRKRTKRRRRSQERWQGCCQLWLCIPKG